jgi:hypothetical protein
MITLKVEEEVLVEVSTEVGKVGPPPLCHNLITLKVEEEVQVWVHVTS